MLTGLVAHWRLDESGTRADAHGDLDLTAVNGPLAQEAVINNGAELLSASAQRLERADTEDLDFGDEPFTFAFWVKPYDLDANDQMPLSKWSAGSYAYCFYFIAGELFFYVSSDGASATAVNSGVTQSPSTWYFVVGWHDPFTDTINISINDGTPVSLAHVGGCYAASGANFELGCDSSDSSHFNGMLDSVSIWRRLLTAEERAALYNAGAGLDYPFAA